jgi:natural product precursor
MKLLSNFSKSVLSKSEMMQVTGGLRCRVENPITGRYEFRNLNVDRCPDLP